ncbi:hypothetical protein AMTRI_Chr09g12480 [Amborella trichopoda]
MCFLLVGLKNPMLIQTDTHVDSQGTLGIDGHVCLSGVPNTSLHAWMHAFHWLLKVLHWKSNCLNNKTNCPTSSRLDYDGKKINTQLQWQQNSVTMLLTIPN